VWYGTQIYAADPQPQAESYNARIYFWISMVVVSKLTVTPPLTMSFSVSQT